MKELEIIKQNSELIQDLLRFMKEKLGYDKDPEIVFLVNNKNAENPLGQTAYFAPDENKVYLFIIGRHIKDVMRSLAHELCHYKQHVRGMFAKDIDASEGYAQNDAVLREAEREAYEIGNMAFRDWEDGIKGQKGVEPNETDVQIQNKVKER